MNILEIKKLYSTKTKCIDLLEKLRWNKTVICPYCQSKSNRPAKSEVGRHCCRNCKRSFTVLVDTIFESSRLALPDWFELIGLVLNAKSGLAAKEIQRSIGCSYKTAYYAAMRVRIGMLMPNTMLRGIIEIDEAYLGGKKRKLQKLPENEPNLSSVDLTRGKKTNKVRVASMLMRKGAVKTQLMEKLTQRNLLVMLKHYASNENTILVTDGFQSYKNLKGYIDHLTINHKKQFSKSIAIESFWSYIKNGIKGSYKTISKKYLPFYLIEYEWKFIYRFLKYNEFEAFLKNTLNNEKELLNWKIEKAKKAKEVTQKFRDFSQKT